ncbi:serine/threonine-protein kinase [Rubrobacter taiwanensis]|uniref:serine/threonine-protein kinase n=1 Tax=Rubrobacter taiwanensis TaxID=185139 RepID=UPI002436F646|nr:protein kinase [Rubrobacter taiwanensis]
MQSTLGEGGMASVYKAEDTVLGRTVAIKVLHPRYASDEAFRRRFKQEARAMASLDHENIVKVYDISQDDGTPFIVAEYVEGRDVGALLKTNGRFNERFTRRIAIQLLRALAYAHRRGVIHRDIKPSNILITQDGTVKVADFGIARLVEDEDVGRPGEIIGSARYMSPEQLTGEETTPRSDIYSVGVFLYHCLTGATPFNGDTRSVARQQIHDEPRSPRLINPEISPRMEHIILRALAKQPAARYPTATAMLDAIRLPAPSEPAPEARKAAAPTTRRSPPRRRRGRLAPMLLVVLLLLVGGGAAAGLTYLTRENPPPVGQLERPDGGRETPAPPAGGVPEENPAAPEEAQVVIPDTDLYFDCWAQEFLQREGFEVVIRYQPREGYANNGVTWATDPPAGETAPEGSTVTVYATPVDNPAARQCPAG